MKCGTLDRDLHALVNPHLAIAACRLIMRTRMLQQLIVYGTDALQNLPHSLCTPLPSRSKLTC